LFTKEGKSSSQFWPFVTYTTDNGHDANPTKKWHNQNPYKNSKRSIEGLGSALIYHDPKDMDFIFWKNFNGIFYHYDISEFLFFMGIILVFLSYKTFISPSQNK
jgi:hypothetical protein